MERYQKIKYNFKNKINAFIKLSAYTLPAIPWISGYFYVQKLLREAKAHARDHEVEDINLALKRKKYKKFEDGKSKAAFQNIAEIKKHTKLECSYLF